MVCKFGEELQLQLQLLQLAFRFWLGLSLGYGWDFLPGLWLFLLGALALEKGALPWLAIGLLPELFYLSRLKGARGWPLCLWLGDNIAILSMVKRAHLFF
jgi:hypothetical protein